MMVLHLANCPPSLRGDITKWLMEIAAGVYVGRVSARVRDKLWERVVETCKGGRAVLVFSTNNEQRLDFRVHGETWEPVDFDGLKLMLRPSPARLIAKQNKRTDSKKTGFSNASRFQKAKRFSNIKIEPDRMLNSYVVVDIETTGLDVSTAEIIEVGAIKIIENQIADTFQSLIKIKKNIPAMVTSLTGITDVHLKQQGKPLDCVLKDIVHFTENLPIVAHNAPFDISFIRKGLEKCKMNALTNRIVDTLALTKRLHKGLVSYKLSALAEHFSFPLDGKNEYKLHRSLGDCHLTHMLYQHIYKT